MERKFLKYRDEEIAAILKDHYDPTAFNELHHRYESCIKKQSMMLVKDAKAAEDLVQEIFIKVFVKIGSFKADALFSTWIYSIAHNTCIDFLRKNKRIHYEKLTQELAERFEDEVLEDDKERLDFTVEDFDKMLEDMEPETRIIMILKYKQQLSIQAIMEQLHISESAVKMRLSRARQKIRKHLITIK